MFSKDLTYGENGRNALLVVLAEAIETILNAAISLLDVIHDFR